MAHIKFLRHGTGSAKKAVQYLTGPKEGRKASVLRGDPDLVAMVADSVMIRHRYSSAVIGFAPEDAPSQEQIDHCLDDFRRAMGLAEERLAWTAIRHDEPGDRVALHILVARVDLLTGRSFNPAPPGWRKRYDPLRDAWNYENGWARPEDPERARLLQPGTRAYIDAENLRKGVGEVDDPKKLITEYLIQRIEAGVVRERAGVIEALEEAGFEINRQGQDYLSIKDKESGLKIRLRGAIYAAEFNTKKLERSVESTEGKKRAGSTPDPERARECRREFEKRLKRVCEYNKERYRVKNNQELDTNLGLDFDGNADRGGTSLADSLGARIGSHGDNIGVEAGENLPEIRKQETLDSGIIDSEGEWTLDYDRQGGENLVTNAPRSEVGEDIQVGRWNGILSDPGEVAHDGNREDLDQRVRTLFRRAGALGERARSSNRALEQSSRRFRYRIDKVRYHVVKLVDGIRGNLEQIKKLAKKKVDAEMERFKKEINLAEFIGLKGYVKEKRLGKSGIIFKGRDGDRILVATQNNYHGVYFNSQDDSDEGSVIEFLMRRRGKDLREARKELRFWLKEVRIVEYIPPVPSTQDQLKILKKIAKMGQEENAFLVQEKKISKVLVTGSRFSGQVLTDLAGCAVFPHFLSGRLTGYEIEKRGFSGFSSLGEKGLWLSQGLGKESKRITICKSGLECLSHAQIHTNRISDYISIAGSLSDSQKSELTMIARMAMINGIEIIVAVGNDSIKMAEEIHEIFRKQGVKTIWNIPENGKGWSEILTGRLQEQLSIVAKSRW